MASKLLTSLSLILTLPLAIFGATFSVDFDLSDGDQRQIFPLAAIPGDSLAFELFAYGGEGEHLRQFLIETTLNSSMIDSVSNNLSTSATEITSAGYRFGGAKITADLITLSAQPLSLGSITLHLSKNLIDGSQFTISGGFRLFATDPLSPFTNTATIVLSGQDIPYMMIQTSTHVFSTTSIGNSQDWNVVIENKGKQTLSISRIISDNSAFSAVQRTLEVPPGETRTLTIRFTPEEHGTISGTLTLVSNNSLKPSFKLELFGTGRGQPTIQVSTATLRFPNTPVGERKEAGIIITNTGTAPLQLADVIFSTRSLFQLTQPFTSTILNLGQSFSLSFIFQPTRAIEYNTTLTVISTDPNNPALDITIQGIGTLPRLGLEQTVLDFGFVPVLKRAMLPLVLRNVGNAPLILEDVILSSGNFSTNANLPVTINPDSAYILPITYVPTRVRADSTTLQITTTDPDRIQNTIKLRGQGAEAPQVFLDVNMLPGNQKVLEKIATKGQQFNLALYIEQSLPISGYVATLSYDPTVLEFIELKEEEGEEKNLLAAKGGTVAPLSILPQEGIAEVGIAILAPNENTLTSGNGLLGQIIFNVIAEKGTTEISLSKVILKKFTTTIDTVTANSTVKLTVTSLIGDFDSNGVVDFNDFFQFADYFGSTNEHFDLDSNGLVDFNDFFLFADNFGKEAQAKLIALAQEYIGLPRASRLEQNYPNPFNPITNIKYQLASESNVEIAIYDILGREVKSFFYPMQSPGYYTIQWDSRADAGEKVAGGIYFYRMKAGTFTETKKMLLVK